MRQQPNGLDTVTSTMLPHHISHVVVNRHNPCAHGERPRDEVALLADAVHTNDGADALPVGAGQGGAVAPRPFLICDEELRLVLWNSVLAQERQSPHQDEGSPDMLQASI